MNNYVAMLRTQAESIMVEVIGMQAENEERIRKGNAVAYNENSFFRKSEELSRIADQINQAR